MTDKDEKEPPRPIFRKLAFGAGAFCILLAVIFEFGPFPKEDKLVTVLICLLAGLVMVTVSDAGFWSRPKKP